MFAALVCVSTIIIRIPSPLGGYINLGDCFVIISGWILGPVYGFMAGGIGSALADLFAGYAVYVPATFIIKGVMALIAAIIIKKGDTLPKKITAAALAEIIMIVGYYFYAVILGAGFIAAVQTIAGNAVQGIFGAVVGVLLGGSLKKLSNRFLSD